MITAMLGKIGEAAVFKTAHAAALTSRKTPPVTLFGMYLALTRPCRASVAQAG